MKIHTDVTTLSRLYPLFKEAGIEGVLTGDYSTIKDLSYPALCEATLEKKSLPEICEIITKSELYIPEEEPKEGIIWSEASLPNCLEVLVRFFYDMAFVLGELRHLNPETRK
jgi:hypothetical protein